MNEYIEIISQIKPKNNQKFAIADVNDLRGGYIQVETISEMQAFLQTNKLKEGMLCYVKTVDDNVHMYQYIGGTWVIWATQGGGTGGMSLKVVDWLADLADPDLQITGQIVFVKETNDLRYYTGSYWASFSRIYIQNSPPDDKGGIWIDTSTEKQFLDSNGVIQNLLQVISILQEKVSKLEWAFQSQMDFGSFTNNKYYEYDNVPAVEPTYGTDPDADFEEQSENLLDNVVEDIEPTEAKDMIPNGTHLCMKAGTYAEMMTNQNDFLPKELLYCYDTGELWIKHPKTLKLVKIGSTSGGGDIDDETMEQILTEVIGTGGSAKTKIVGIEFADMSDKTLTFRVQVNNGKLEVRDYRLDINSLAGNSQTLGSGIYYTNAYFPIPSDLVGSIDSPKIYINSVYTGGEGDKYDYNPVSHNFIELCNLGKTDLNLKGLYLHYTERGSGIWVTLPLSGTLKAQGTYLIRGAQCSVQNVNTTYINVNSFDAEWTKDATYNNTALEISEDIGAGVEAHSIWDENNKIKLSTSCSLYISGEESTEYFKTNPLTITAPWSVAGVLKWYVDLVGIGKYNNVNMPSESAPIATTGSNYIFMRYYNMDPVSQATKSISARKNSTDWTYINPVTYIKPGTLNKNLSITDYTPKASEEGKDIFFNKNLLKEGAPNVVTCSLGYNAHTTRTFNWVSVGYYDEYIWFTETPGDYSDANNKFESFKSGDGRTLVKNWNSPIYDRIRSITTDGTPFTVHKFIKDFVEPTSGTTKTYYYKVGRDGAWTEERSFTLRNRQDVIDSGFNFLHVTDQQGFNSEEYESWRLSAEYINADKSTNPYHFCMNTGDATQNGNRINEWLDYFEAGKDIFKDTEQMYVVGNNDLSPLDPKVLGVGDDLSKINPINVNYFFTFELPFGIPTSQSGVFIPSVYSFIYGNTYFLAMNSEITELTRSSIYEDPEGVNVYTNQLLDWCTNDLLNHSEDTDIVWRVAFMHESPYSIITANLIMSYLIKDIGGVYQRQTNIQRGGSHLNTVGNYWFSQFLQDNNFKLCLCGHKHSFANSRLIREDITKTMEPIVYDPDGTNAAWYQSLPEREKMCVKVTNTPGNFVKYVMNQATGYKQTSNKELPAQNIPWLQEYYPCATQVENATTNTATQTVNTAQSFPHYIIWNIGRGSELEDPLQTTTERDRIKGSVYKLKRAGSSASWYYKYNVPYTYTQLEKAGGNGVATSSNIDANNNIIIELTV